VDLPVQLVVVFLRARNVETGHRASPRDRKGPIDFSEGKLTVAQGMAGVKVPR
jgi:hypothetical protein